MTVSQYCLYCFLLRFGQSAFYTVMPEIYTVIYTVIMSV